MAPSAAALVLTYGALAFVAPPLRGVARPPSLFSQVATRPSLVRLAVSADEAERLDGDALLALWSQPRETALWSEQDWERVYRSAERRGLLPGFGSVTGLAPTAVSVADLEARSGLGIGALTPSDSGTQWLLYGVGFFLVELALARTFGVENSLARSLPFVFALFAFDQIVLGSRLTLGIILWLRPEYQQKLARHEAGHFLLAFLCGLPVTGYFLAGNSQAAGQAGTIFLDTDLFTQINGGKLRQSALARYSTILMAGIAAEAIGFGSAEGGYADEQALVDILRNLRPPWETERIYNLARWSVVNAVELLREYEPEHDALAAKMGAGAPLGECLAAITTSIRARQKLAPAAASAD
jgi:hypothetical protein